MKRLISVLLASVMILAALLCTGASAVDLNDVIVLPIVMYHAVKPDKCGKDSITPWEFESDLKFLRENGYETVTIGDLQSFIDGESSLPEKPVMLTFDDGYYNNYKYVYPLLQKYNMRIVMSIITHATDKFTRKPSRDEGYAHITWGQLNEMLDSGLVEVQNHSYNMHSIGKGRVGCGQKQGETTEEYEIALASDIIMSQAMIYEMTGNTPSAFAYPYGKYNDNTTQILKKLGFSSSFTCEFGVNLINKDGTSELWNLKRICRSHGHNACEVIGEAMKTLKFR